ncbi:isochorismatase family protein [Catellatospora bangladeshensis]|uniref:isochorismatase family protein n=1 Tax=Catellatospora bangladeshensis TaxID=310355 RepID=UPI00361FEA88
MLRSTPVRREGARAGGVRRGQPAGEFPPELAPAPGEHVVHKHYASAFAGTSLPAWLTANGVDTLVIGGFSTSGCVRASAVDALQHGFRPMVVREACADRDPGPHDANLFDLDAKYADVVPLAEALTRLS